VFLRATNPDVVGQLDTGTEEVVASVDAKNCAEAVFKVVLQESVGHTVVEYLNVLVAPAPN
jgi:hypothetical protein